MVPLDDDPKALQADATPFALVEEDTTPKKIVQTTQPKSKALRGEDEYDQEAYEDYHTPFSLEEEPNLALKGKNAGMTPSMKSSSMRRSREHLTSSLFKAEEKELEVSLKDQISQYME